eukprot:15464758-Alexandrium_andersonii.AAC.1
MPRGAERTKEVLPEEARDIATACLQLVEGTWSASEHIPACIRDFTLPLEVSSCQGSFPTTVMFLGALAGLTNGASINLWTTAPTPLSIPVFYVGDPQQGKSRLTAFIAQVTAFADEFLACKVQEQLDTTEAPAGVTKPARLTIKTLGMMDFTAREFFARSSGDWPQMSAGDAFDLDSFPGSQPRAWHALLVNIDEAGRAPPATPATQLCI